MRELSEAATRAQDTRVAVVREMAARDWDRVASDYFAEVVSPLEAGIPAPLLTALDAAARAGARSVADLGCGIGTLLPTLADRFENVLGVDFSAAMLTRARTTCSARNVRLARGDLADLSRFARCFDAAVTVNAVLTPDSSRLDRIFAGLQACLRPGGVLLGIFPAMEAILYQGFLIHERERAVCLPKQARQRTGRLLERAKYDFVFGTYREGKQAQKFFYEFELRHRLRSAGLRRIRVGRITYPWTHVGGFERFPDEPPMWDWFVCAERAGDSGSSKGR